MSWNRPSLAINVPGAQRLAGGIAAVVVGFGLVALFAGCRGGTAREKPSPDMSPNVRPFYNAEEHPQSPKPANPQFRGVLISAPPQHTISARSPMLLLRGAYRIQGNDYPKDDRLRLTAVNSATQQRFSAYAGQQESSPEAPPPPSDPPNPETVRRMIFSGFFNTDLMATLGLPWTNAVYKVKAELGNIPSNEIIVEIIIQQ